MNEEIIELLHKNLGPYRENNGGWYSFNCPVCSANAGKEYDGKFNLECHVEDEELFYHCWSCSDTDGTKGHLSKLIKSFGKEEYNAYLNIIQNAPLLSLKKKKKIFKESQEVFLPQGTKLLDNGCCTLAHKYLEDRGITKEMIKKHSIGYTTEDAITPLEYQNRIVIPSFNKFGEINFVVCRDYKGVTKVRYMNSTIDRKSAIINEYLLDFNKDIILVEGMFDHIVVPNSTPLLGKHLDLTFSLYSVLVEEAKADIVIFLDGDAYNDAVKIYRMLDSNIKLHGRVYIVRNNRKDLDPSDIYKLYGEKGISDCLKTKHRIHEFDLYV